MYILLVISTVRCVVSVVLWFTKLDARPKQFAKFFGASKSAGMWKPSRDDSKMNRRQRNLFNLPMYKNANMFCQNTCSHTELSVCLCFRPFACQRPNPKPEGQVLFLLFVILLFKSQIQSITGRVHGLKLDFNELQEIAKLRVIAKTDTLHTILHALDHALHVVQ